MGRSHLTATAQTREEILLAANAEVPLTARVNQPTNFAMISITNLPFLLGLSPLLAQDASESTPLPPTFSPVFMIVWLLVVVLLIAAMWKVFVKAGQPGWASLIPIYNAYILCKIAGRPGWWLLLLLIPFVNFIIAIIICIDVAKNFGKGVGFGLGLAFLGIIFFPILGFGSAAYQGAPRATI
jgi:hypothetical protein